MSAPRSRFQPVAITLTVLAALVRLAPHPPNFTSVGATAMFGGSRLRGWQAYLIPLLAMVVTDPLRSMWEGNYPAYSWGTAVTYGCFMISVVLGRILLRDSPNPGRIAAVVLAGSIQFFCITNLFVWFGSSMYPHTIAGLTTCYAMALPFFGYTVAGDLFYSGVLFGVYAMLKHYGHETQRNRAAAA